MSSPEWGAAGRDGTARQHDLIVVGVTCTEEIIGVDSLQALDSHREIEICGRWQSVGGNGLNVAVHAARLGADVALISKIPRDIWPEVTGALKRSGVDASFLVPEYVSPAPAVLLVTDDQGEYGVFVSDRAGLAFNPADVAHVTGMAARHVHFDGFSLGALNLGSQIESAQNLLEVAGSSGAVLSIDLNGAICDSQPERVREIVPQADILFANGYEALAVTGAASAEEAARTLISWDLPMAVVKNGSEGLICATRRRLDCLSAIEVPVVDSIGAGDGVVAGTLWGLLRGLDLHEAARIGAAVAALVCTGHGSQGAEFEKADVDRLCEEV
ncbi:MAG: carbohydrate kinase family protein [Caldilineaceae bacterium]|nr:carbohydrate kinase family protein [Caldilineaceae bacterium]MDE0339738.1 carbohydrate kinase family protein [Caldilineaceae bacterium]